MEKSQEVKSLESIKDHYIALKQELSKVIVGQTKVIDDLILAIFCKAVSYTHLTLPTICSV